jgi:hypothetical protein
MDISTPHQKTPLFIKSWSMIVQMLLLLSCTHCPFCSGHFNPIKKLFSTMDLESDYYSSRYSFESGTLNPNPGPLPYPKVSFMVTPIGYQRKTKSYSSATVHYYTQLYFLPGNRYLFAERVVIISWRLTHGMDVFARACCSRISAKTSREMRKYANCT